MDLFLHGLIEFYGVYECYVSFLSKKFWNKKKFDVFYLSLFFMTLFSVISQVNLVTASLIISKLHMKYKICSIFLFQIDRRCFFFICISILILNKSPRTTSGSFLCNKR